MFVLNYADSTETGRPRKSVNECAIRVKKERNVTVHGWIVAWCPFRDCWSNLESSAAFGRVEPVRFIMSQHDVAYESCVAGRTGLDGAVQPKELAAVRQSASNSESKWSPVINEFPGRSCVRPMLQFIPRRDFDKSADCGKRWHCTARKRGGIASGPALNRQKGPAQVARQSAPVGRLPGIRSQCRGDSRSRSAPASRSSRETVRLRGNDRVRG